MVSKLVVVTDSFVLSMVCVCLCVQTFLGDFQKEQEKFVQEKKAKKSGKIRVQRDVIVLLKIFTRQISSQCSLMVCVSLF